MEGTFKELFWHKIEGLEGSLKASKLYLASIVQKEDQNHLL